MGGFVGFKVQDKVTKKHIKYFFIQEDTTNKDTSGNTTTEETREYIYGNGGMDDVIAMIKDGNTYYYHKDNLGSIVAISDSLGNIVEQYRYDVFGKTYIESNGTYSEFKTSSVGNTRLYTGREYDSESELYFYRARYYNAELGRFINRDPIGTNDQINLYTYVGNNPLIYTDPSGKIAWFAAMAIGGAASVGMGYGIECLSAFIEGRDVNYSWKDAGIDFGMGAVGGGFAAKLANVGKLYKAGIFTPTGKVLTVLGDGVIGWVGGAAKTGCFIKSLSSENFGKNLAISIIGSVAGHGVERLFGSAKTVVANSKITQEITKTGKAYRNKIEKEILNLLGDSFETGGKAKMNSPTGTANYRIADGINETAIAEVKGGFSSLIDKNQLNDYLINASKEGKKLIYAFQNKSRAEANIKIFQNAVGDDKNLNRILDVFYKEGNKLIPFKYK